MKRRPARATPGAALPKITPALAGSPWWRAAIQMQQIAWQAPWVIWSRSLMLADPRRAASTRGRRESARMVSEKHDAALQAWAAMSRAWWAPGRASPPQRAARATQAGLAPVSRRVGANLKRLGRSR